MSARAPRPSVPTLGREADQGFALWRDAMEWQRRVNAALRPFGLTHTQFLVLASLDRAQRKQDEAVSQRAIGLEAKLDEATTSAVVQALDRRGLVDRGVTDHDHRVWQVIVSSAGHRLLAQATPAVDAAGIEFFGRRGQP